ncbi:hypothetical protein Tco_0220019, partial [Tanacetum coccineum]
TQETNIPAGTQAQDSDSAVVRPNAAGSHDLVATIDGREVIVTESLIRTQLHFDDANGIFDMPNSEILEGMRVM